MYLYLLLLWFLTPFQRAGQKRKLAWCCYFLSVHSLLIPFLHHFLTSGSFNIHSHIVVTAFELIWVWLNLYHVQHKHIVVIKTNCFNWVKVAFTGPTEEIGSDFFWLKFGLGWVASDFGLHLVSWPLLATADLQTKRQLFIKTNTQIGGG